MKVTFAESLRDTSPAEIALVIQSTVTAVHFMKIRTETHLQLLRTGSKSSYPSCRVFDGVRYTNLPFFRTASYDTAAILAEVRKLQAKGERNSDVACALGAAPKRARLELGVRPELGV